MKVGRARRAATTSRASADPLADDYLSTKDVRQRAVTGAAVDVLRGVGVKCVGLVGLLVLARMLTPTDFGLVAGVWTQDGGRQLRMARAVHSGQVFVNNYGAGGGVEVPFGGVKHSGYGREKGFEALYGFTTLKTVVLLHG